jgi:hypothetical protein
VTGAVEQQINEPGLGYSYSADKVVEKNGEKFTGAEDAKKKLTDLAYSMCTYTWAEQEAVGSLFFMVGGINSVNPFDARVMKNEPGIYRNIFTESKPLLHAPTYVEKAVFNSNHQPFDFDGYDDIYIDFNGSMAFFDSRWMELLDSKLRAAFVMGGVYADGTPPLTMSSIPNVLNRFTCSTMNQLYEPSKTALFFEYLASHNIPCFLVANNTVASMGKKNSPVSFLEKNSLAREGTDFLVAAARAYYAENDEKDKAEFKPFDMYTAVAVGQFLDRAMPHLKHMTLYYDDKYGISLVAAAGLSAAQAVANHIQGLEAKMAALNGNPVLTPGFVAEIEFFKGLNLDALKLVEVYNLEFEGKTGDKALRVI